MTESPRKEGPSDVPAQVFEKFIQTLEEAALSAELITRFRKTLLEDQAFTERALKDAVFGEEPLP